MNSGLDNVREKKMEISELFCKLVWFNNNMMWFFENIVYSIVDESDEKRQ